MDSSSYVPLLVAENGDDVVIDVPQRSKCKDVLIYSMVTLIMMLSFAAPLYFLFPRYRSSSSNTVTIVNRYSDDISVYEIDPNGEEKILAKLGPNDHVRLFPEQDNRCFVRHRESYIALEQVHEEDATIVLGDQTADDVVPSRSGGQEQLVTFINDEEEPVVISWVNFEGAEVEITSLGPGEQYDMKTFFNHRFSISSAATHRILGQFTVRPDAAVIRTRQILETKNQQIMVAVENRTSGPMNVMWRDAAGVDHDLGELEANTKSVVETYIGHELYIVDSDGDQSEPIIIVPSVTALRAVPLSDSK